MKRLLSIFMALVIGGLIVVAPPVRAAEVFDPCRDEAVTNSEICTSSKGTSKLFGAGGIWNRILNTITFLIGGISVLMIIIGAVRYALSAGDQSQVTAAKNTILYAIIALIVAVMANAIVNFVLTNI